MKKSVQDSNTIASSMDEATAHTIEHFIEKMGLIAQADGLPRIAGRILAVLVIYDEPHSFTDLTEKLAVSRGSISTNTRLLVNLGLIERSTKKGERQDYFVLRENPYTSLMQGIEARTQEARALLKATKSDLPDVLEGAQTRLSQMLDFYNKFSEAVKSLT
uniref:GbsR/MarR family transcriptional regulator n=1 Tax=Ningiella ruwaisensis TaxID=2364274 RepID=UPI001F4F7248|nr:MarR family transcriptional regulator [Ningiella ruwaisensis]